MSWWGALDMDAERAPLGHGWPVGASPHHGTGAKKPPRSGGRTSAQNGFPLCRNKGVDRQGETRISRDQMQLLPRDTMLDTELHTAGNRHSIGAIPFCSRYLLARLKCPQPRKPL